MVFHKHYETFIVQGRLGEGEGAGEEDKGDKFFKSMYVALESHIGCD